MNRKYLENLKKFFRNLFHFRLHNLEMLMDSHYHEKISEIYPSLILKDGEFPGYKFNILKYLSWNGEELIQNPSFYGFDEDIFPGLRYKKISSWDRFGTLSQYTGELYSFIKEYVILCKKIIFTKDFSELSHLREEFSRLHLKIDITVENNWL